MNQYFMQKKHKYAQIDSPKDGSIERARQTNIMQQEVRPSTSKNTVTMPTQGDEAPILPLESLKKKDPFGAKKSNKASTTEYIIQNIESKSGKNLSPRSKEVSLIK